MIRHELSFFLLPTFKSSVSRHLPLSLQLVGTNPKSSVSRLIPLSELHFGLKINTCRLHFLPGVVNYTSDLRVA